jgi:hypothetical protein
LTEQTQDSDDAYSSFDRNATAPRDADRFGDYRHASRSAGKRNSELHVSQFRLAGDTPYSKA